MKTLEYVRRRLINGRVSNKLILYTTVLLVCSLLAIGITSYEISLSAIKEKISGTNIQILRQTAGNMDFMLKGIENVFKQVFDGADICKYLNESDSTDSGTIIENNKNITGEINKLLNLREEVEYVYIVGKDGVAYTNDRLEKYYPIDLALYNKLLKNNHNGLVWTLQKKRLFEYNENARIALCRAVTDISGKNIGFVVILLKEEVFDEIYANLCNQKRQVFLVDNENIIVSCPDPERAGLPFDSVHKVSYGMRSYIGRVYGNRSLVSCVLFEHTNWKLYMVEQYDSIFGGINRIKTWMTLTIFICIVVFIILSILFSLIATSRIKKLLELVKLLNKPGDGLPVEFAGKAVTGGRGIINRVLVRFNFKTMLSIVLLCLVLLPIIFSMAVTYSVTSGVVKEKIVETNILKNRQVKKRLEYYIKTTEKSLNYIYFENALKEILDKGKYDSYDAYEDDIKIIESVLTNIYSQNRNIIYANLYKLNGNIAYSLGFGDRSVSQDMLRRVKEKDTIENVWFGAYKDYYNAYVITLGRKIRDINSFTDWGYIFVSIRESDIADIYAEDISSGDFSFIIDESGEVISHVDKTLLGRKPDYPFYKDVLNGKMNNFIKNYNGEDLLVNSEIIKDTGWRMVNISSVRPLEDNMKRMLLYDMLVFLFSTVVVVMIVVYISNKISGPINKLTGRVKRFGANDSETDGQIATGDEIEELSINFEKMMDRIKKLIEEVYEVRIKKNEAELKKKEAELSMLQAQINPHFLYNTLEIIRWEAMHLTKGENKVSDIVTSLSRFFRLSLGKGMKLVTLRDEVEHIKNYVKIMNLRYDNIVTVNYSIEPEILNCLMPKVTLQPIVENAIIHGIAQREGKGIINISGSTTGKGIIISVKDNGIGISEAGLEEMKKALNDNGTNDNTGYGLKNINQRIKLYFGEEYGLYIDSEQNEYTIVNICIKKQFGDVDNAV